MLFRSTRIQPGPATGPWPKTLASAVATWTAPAASATTMTVSEFLVAAPAVTTGREQPMAAFATTMHRWPPARLAASTTSGLVHPNVMPSATWNDVSARGDDLWQVKNWIDPTPRSAVAAADVATVARASSVLFRAGTWRFARTDFAMLRPLLHQLLCTRPPLSGGRSRPGLGPSSPLCRRTLGKTPPFSYEVGGADALVARASTWSLEAGCNTFLMAAY